MNFNSKKVQNKPALLPKRPRIYSKFGITWEDPWDWLKHKDDPEVLEAIRCENAYAESVLEDTLPLRKKLEQEFQQQSPRFEYFEPMPWKQHRYGWEIPFGKNYKVFFRLDGQGQKKILKDFNADVQAEVYLDVGFFEVHPNENGAMAGIDYDGTERYRLFWVPFDGGAIVDLGIDDLSDSVFWSHCGKDLVGVQINAVDRPDRVMGFDFQWQEGQPVKVNHQRTIFVEQDPAFFVSCRVSVASGRLFVMAEANESSEVHVAEFPLRDKNPLRCLFPRCAGVEYSVFDQKDHLVMLTNLNLPGSQILYFADFFKQPDRTVELNQGVVLVSASDTGWIEDVEVFEQGILFCERRDIQKQVGFCSFTDGRPTPRWFVSKGSGRLTHWSQLESGSETARFSWSSPQVPIEYWDLQLATGNWTLLWKAELGAQVQMALTQLETELRWFTSVDGVQVPATLVYQRDQQEHQQLPQGRPVVVYGYGAYGFPLDLGYSSVRLSLLSRGVVFVIAHVRGGSDLGRNWYLKGKKEFKQNSFNDLQAIVAGLYQQKVAAPGNIVLWGASAGGLLVGATVNQIAEPLAGVVGEVPFVDVLHTMLDDQLPLTPLEYQEWGNPNEPEAFHRIRAYSPYDQLHPKVYPAVYFSAGFNDPRVTYWEPLKWITKVRELDQGDAPKLLVIDLQSGHAGSAGRVQHWKEQAGVLAFILFALKGSRDADGV